ncbi:hypothetical protein AVO45_10935 [Ruegeria marisrubri]|uniref:DUF2927 domain-containing protein n=1 Tax=Ruegeria marisrubri TaxID=1685379 RepID=A0A0X3TMQ2_9RHOB|nr:DUF2927 domain-containing protein [Ruegeria marisrubri]KUJ77057.1 hypothetical protein AVO45_10935 [Ruegeria marisrubri]
MGTAALLLALAGCETALVKSAIPQSRPTGPAAPAETVTEPSAASRDLARYYEKVQNDLLTRGLLRTDGGGPDTPYDADDLVRNFEAIAFYSEYPGQAILATSRRTSGYLSRWQGPVRIATEFGPSVPLDQRAEDRAQIDAYAERLSRVTRHPIKSTNRNPNFHVFVAGEDDTGFVQNRLRQLIPNIGQAQLDLFDNLPRSFYCFVFASANNGSPHNYTRAVALIRAEHPDLVRLSCIHEEIAQGLGLPNDSPSARPSIFNDDDEFALLTSHDEKLLAMLYDPRMKPGMSADQARPVAHVIASELVARPR